MAQLAGKRITIGVTGGIAAYKTAEWIRALRREEAEVQVVQTEAAARFITPLTLAALSGRRVYGDIFSPEDAELIPHINLARHCDLLLIAPATANTIAKLAHGQADNLLTAIALATRAPVLICPAMNSNMYLHPATQANLASLRQYGCIIAPPAAGAMACGDEGPGGCLSGTQFGSILPPPLPPRIYRVSISSSPPAPPMRILTRYVLSATAHRARWVMPWPGRPASAAPQSP